MNTGSLWEQRSDCLRAREAFDTVIRPSTMLGVDVSGERCCWERIRSPEKNFNHRREWGVEHLKLLITGFAIDVGFVATLSNHFHVVLRTHPRLTKRMGTHEATRPWVHGVRHAARVFR
jgi:hypothetical protein